MEPKTVLPSMMLEISSASFATSMATFNEESVLSHPSGCWDVVLIAQSWRGCDSERQRYEVPAAKKGANPNRDERP